jgi:hypothetical protein
MELGLSFVSPPRVRDAIGFDGAPLARSLRGTHLHSVSAVPPIFMAIDWIAARCDG